MEQKQKISLKFPYIGMVQNSKNIVSLSKKCIEGYCSLHRCAPTLGVLNAIIGDFTMYRILTDDDLSRILPTDRVINVIEQALRAKAMGSLIAPPRFSAGVDGGALVFTVGAETAYFQAIGFRVYDTFSTQSLDRTQLVAVFDSQTGGFKGLVIGRLIGALRTAAINAVAIKSMARADVRHLGILGSGFQARTHMQAAMVVRHFERARVHSPTANHRDAFATEMSAETGIPVEAMQSVEEVVRFSDVLICATRSTTPVFDAAWLKPGLHINTIGPKFRDAHEISVEIAQKSQVIATDSLDQVDSYSESFFLLGTPERSRMIELSEIVAGRQKGRSSPSDITLFCSVGLAGSEVVVANEALSLVNLRHG